MTNRSRIVLYTGVTNSLERRIWFHRNNAITSFTKTYKIDLLVYYEAFDNAADAIAREKEIKGWRREKKNELVQSLNPKWEDLARDVRASQRESDSTRTMRVMRWQNMRDQPLDCEVPRRLRGSG